MENKTSHVHWIFPMTIRTWHRMTVGKIKISPYNYTENILHDTGVHMALQNAVL